MKKTKTIAPLAAVLASVMGTSAIAATNLVVYTAMETENLEPARKLFEAAHPDIKIKWVRNSTGIVTAKVLAEKNNRRADVVFTLAATSLLQFKKQGMLHPYSPKGIETLNDKMADDKSNPHWVGQSAWVSGLCINTEEMKANNLPMPSSWADLTKPVYKGHVVMPNPASSGTGYLDVSSWIQLFGEDKAWSYMDKLHKNIEYYTHSGSKPCKLAGRGEIAIGVSFIYKGVGIAKKGAPIVTVTPSEGLGWELNSAAIMKGTKKLDAAKKFLDWVISEEASKFYNKSYAVISRDSLAKPIPGYPADVTDRMIKNDFQWASSNRDRILKEWKKRYDSKSEAK